MNRLAMMVLKNLHHIPFKYAKLCKYAKNPDNYPEEEMYAHIQSILNLAIRGGNVTVDVHGLENIPTEGGWVMYANHQGLFDILAIVANCPSPMSAVYKKELANVPLLREVSSCLRGFAMDREDVRQSLEVIQGVTKEIINGRNYVIFPEGTRSKEGNVMGDFHHGSFRCAIKSKCPVIPVTVIDSYKVLDQKGSAPITMQLHYLPPILPEEYQGMKTNQLAALVKSRIQACMDENIK